MLGIKDALKRIYSDGDGIQKHLILFVLTGVTAMFSTPLNDMSSLKTLTTEQWIFAICALLMFCVVSFYTSGYLLEFIHNAHKKEQNLPNITKSCFVTAFKSLPIFLAWLGYLIGTLIICFGFSAISKKLGAVLLLVWLVFFLFALIFVPLLFVEYSREYEFRGLCSIPKLFEFFKKTCGYVTVLILKMLPLFIIILLINAFSSQNSTLLGYMGTAIGGYCGYIYSMVLYFCYLQILDEVKA